MSTHQLDYLASLWRRLDPAEKLRVFREIKEESKESASIIATMWAFLARDAQYLPPNDNWSTWLYVGGFGSGKTWSGARFIIDCVQKGYTRLALAGRSSADVRDIMINSPGGLKQAAQEAGIVMEHIPSLRRVNFPQYNAYAITYSADEPDQFRGDEHDAMWIDELCSWKKTESFDLAQTRLRYGPKPLLFISTTPEINPNLLKLLKSAMNGRIVGNKFELADGVIDEEGTVWVSNGSTLDNACNLPDSYINDMKKRYEGTRAGRSALYGEILLSEEGALWSYEQLQELYITKEETLAPASARRLTNVHRIVIGIDPAVTSKQDSDSTGIVVAGINYDTETAYILGDYTIKKGIDQCSGLIAQLYNIWKADCIVAEVNQGGDVVEHIIRSTLPRVMYKPVRATRGKYVRAEPIAALYEQGKVKHVKPFPLLEDEMLIFTQNMEKSPDRVDALVWALTELMLNNNTPTLCFEG